MDKYSLNARVYPMVILFLPLVVIGISYSIEYESYIQALSTLGISTALYYFLSNIGRDFGKKKEKLLWEFWGGAPTSQIFNYQNEVVDNITKTKYHNRLLELSPIEFEINFQNEELDKINEVYRSWTKYLITNTRDTKKYSLLFKENISYGFRRNLWGLKNLSISLIIICIIGNYTYQTMTVGFKNLFEFPIEFIISESILVLLLLVWLLIVNKNWIKVPAFAYAERLLESIDTL